MDESYELVGGEYNSYIDGPYSLPDPRGFCDAGAPTAAGAAVIANGCTLECANTSDPVYKALGVGSNGFPGYSPEFSGEYTRDSYAIYGDLSAEVTEDLFLQGAIRFEDYSDFDSELVWKVVRPVRVLAELLPARFRGYWFPRANAGSTGEDPRSSRLRTISRWPPVCSRLGRN